MKPLLEVVKSRKSVRTFDGKQLLPEECEKLKAYASEITNPFGIPVTFVFMDADTFGLSSPVLVGEKMYVAGKVKKGICSDVAFGYSFEKMVLYAWSLGIGTTWIGGTMKREAFERAAHLSNGELMPCVSPLGYPAKKKSVRESMMRRGVGADTRLPAEKLFFEESFEVPLTGQKKEEIADLIELVRWAPSAVNKQPWRIVLKDGAYHFYKKGNRGYTSDAAGDLQKIDVGIALCHFVMGMEERKESAEVCIADPGIDVPENTEYIATVLRQ